MLREVIDYADYSDTYAVFGEVTRTAWEKLEVSLGLRLDWTVRELHRTRDFTLGSEHCLTARRRVGLSL